MNKNLMAAAGAAMLGGSAMAEPTHVFADITPTCDIVSQVAAIDLTGIAPNSWSANADFTYSCNFIGSPTLTFISANGGLVNPDNGGDEVDYGIYLNDASSAATPSGSQLASNATAPGISFSNLTTTIAPNANRSPIFKVGPLAALTVAGTYEDILTISIAP